MPSKPAWGGGAKTIARPPRDRNRETAECSIHKKKRGVKYLVKDEKTGEYKCTEENSCEGYSPNKPTPSAPKDENAGALMCDLCGQSATETKNATLREHHEKYHPEFLAFIEQTFDKLEVASAAKSGVAAADPSTLEALGRKVVEIASSADGGRAKWDYVVNSVKQLNAIFGSDAEFTKCNVFLFGSCVAQGSWDGFGDIDCTLLNAGAWCATVAAAIAAEKEKAEKGQDAVVDTPSVSWPPSDEGGVILKAARLLRNAGFRFDDLEPVVKTRVPIVKHKASRKDRRHYLGDPRCSMIKFTFSDKRSGNSVKSADVDKCFHEHTLSPKGMIIDASSKEYQHRPNERLVLYPSGDVAISSVMATDWMNISGAEKMRIKKDWATTRCKPEIFHTDFDLSCRGHGVRNSYLLRGYLSQTHSVRMGSVFLKKWGKKCGVNNSMKGFLTSYAVNILWIHFLLRRKHVTFIDPESIPLVPQADAWEQGCTYVPMIPEHFVAPTSAATSSGEDAAAAKDVEAYHAKEQLRSDDATDLGALLLDFFYFYATEFDWENDAISVNMADGHRKKADLGWTQDKEQTTSTKFRERIWYRVAIEDPFEVNLNLGRHLSPVKFGKIRAEFASAFEIIVGGGDAAAILKDRTASTAEDVCLGLLGRCIIGLGVKETMDLDEIKKRIAEVNPRALGCFEVENKITKLISDAGLILDEVVVKGSDEPSEVDADAASPDNEKEEGQKPQKQKKWVVRHADAGTVVPKEAAAQLKKVDEKLNRFPGASESSKAINDDYHLWMIYFQDPEAPYRYYVSKKDHEMAVSMRNLIKASLDTHDHDAELQQGVTLADITARNVSYQLGKEYNEDLFKDTYADVTKGMKLPGSTGDAKRKHRDATATPPPAATSEKGSKALSKDAMMDSAERAEYSRDGGRKAAPAATPVRKTVVGGAVAASTDKKKQPDDAKPFDPFSAPFYAYVGNVDPSALSEQDMRDVFEPIGCNVIAVTISKPKKMAFVRFHAKEDLELAIKKGHGTKVSGKALKVTPLTESQHKSVSGTASRAPPPPPAKREPAANDKKDATEKASKQSFAFLAANRGGGSGTGKKKK